MNSRISILALCALLFGAPAAAQQEDSVVEIAVNDGTTDEDIVIRIDSKEQGFNLHELQLGESRSLTTADGRPVTVTRAADSFDFAVDGRTISMPVMPPHADGPPPPGAVHHKEMHIVRKFGPGGPDNAEAVTIISHVELDDATRASITAALAAAGLNEVQFIDTSEMVAGHPGPMMDGEEKEVRIIRKKVHVTN